MANSVVGTLRRKQLDRSLSDIGQPHIYQVPRSGWIREVRDALGMSARQLASRIGVAQATVAKLE